MIGYVTLGSNDIGASSKFYDNIFTLLHIERLADSENFVSWGRSWDFSMLGITKPFDNQRATVGNGVMVAIAVENRKTVDDLHARAMELGAADEGAPGPRGKGGFYAGYFRDLDGNKLNFYCNK